jgi:hypothetical protein
MKDRNLMSLGLGFVLVGFEDIANLLSDVGERIGMR